MIFGGLALDLAPADLMALVADVVARWTGAQTTLGNVFAELIGARAPAAVNIFASFDSFAAQRKMLVMAAEDVLPKRYCEVFRAALSVIEGVATERHRFAHWMWGIYMTKVSKADFLLLADPKKTWRLRAQQIRHFRRFKIEDSRAAHLSQPRLAQKEVFVYREDDLRKVKRQMMRAAGYAHALEDLVRATPKQRLHIDRALRAESHIRQVLETKRRKETKHERAALKPPRVSSRARREAALARHK
ncbi:MAG: hypothetical protein AAB403_17925 [Planctomycetota bacterium]